jgi:hypothetical protein
MLVSKHVDPLDDVVLGEILGGLDEQPVGSDPVWSAVNALLRRAGFGEVDAYNEAGHRAWPREPEWNRLPPLNLSRHAGLEAAILRVVRKGR